MGLWLLCTHSFRSKKEENPKYQHETTAEAWPLLKQPSEYGPPLENSSAPSATALGIGLVWDTLCVKSLTPFHGRRREMRLAVKEIL